MTPEQLLEKAADYIEKYGYSWNFGMVGGPGCEVGALAKVLDNQCTPDHTNREHLDLIQAASKLLWENKPKPVESDSLTDWFLRKGSYWQAVCSYDLQKKWFPAGGGSRGRVIRHLRESAAKGNTTYTEPVTEAAV